MDKIKVAVLGATGMVGQRFITLLENHPYFDVTVLAASERSAGKKYKNLMSDKWKIERPMPKYAEDITVKDVYDVENISKEVSLAFCALNMSANEIKDIEERYAKAEVVIVSNNSANRHTPDVPMLMPEINYRHLEAIPAQKKRLGTKYGFILVKPNCSIQSYVPALDALKEFGLEKVIVSTYQAISGSGKTFSEWPEINDNVIPYISGEEEKSEKEPLKVWGTFDGNKFINATKPIISAQCIRVPVSDGHLATVSVKFTNKPTIEEIIDRWENYTSEISKYNLPTSPAKFLTYFKENDRPQTGLDRNLYGGMGISVGRIREDNILDYKFVCLSHNTLRGAAGGALLGAELLKARGYLER